MQKTKKMVRRIDHVSPLIILMEERVLGVFIQTLCIMMGFIEKPYRYWVEDKKVTNPKKMVRRIDHVSPSDNAIEINEEIWIYTYQ